MQDPPSELSRLGLARFRSAPATWLDALLDDDDHHGTLTQLLSSVDPVPNPGPAQSSRPGNYLKVDGPDPGLVEGAPVNSAAFHRMNSSPAEFLGANMDGYFSGFGIPATSYDDVSPARKRLRESDTEQHSPSFTGQRRGELTTANSLVEMEMEKLLEDSVACRVRAKRGCATHPRSIAERVRRTRISDRIRKLQELVPNMDKQTNTADMLEEAVEYVKTLQRQIQDLTEQQKRCKCMAMS
ncbi:hypothetical protein RND81_03G228400 [Saponaria officinalis]|uniref:BHLH domain-containing protein n=1 Tax=Saponaria officinalis TaxID=3572 RepID=A0AAW1MAP2_SAPOF